MKKFLSEFKAFALKGNVLDMAVGVIIATAFTGIVKSLTENFINPILQFVTVGKRYSLLEIRVLISNFATEVVNFIITAFVLFCLVKLINKLMNLRKKEEVKAPPVTKICPFCKSEINIEASRCPNCTSDVE